jgi:hypothetical protein
MEATMKILTITELLCLTRVELIELHLSLSNQLAELPEGSTERHDSLATLANIRSVLARPEFGPRRGGSRPPTP